MEREICVTVVQKFRVNVSFACILIVCKYSVNDCQVYEKLLKLKMASLIQYNTKEAINFFCLCNNVSKIVHEDCSEY